MRILITNNTLASRAGTELYVRDIALRLRELGHVPLCFSLELGEVAQELRAEGVTVSDDLASLEAPDIIHGHHAIETTLAGITFPHTPVISFCHGPKAWQEAPCRLPSVAAYVAVDESCRLRLEQEEGIPPENIRMILNFVDTRRFKPRPPLPPKPRRALMFSNHMSEGTALNVVREACESAGVILDTCGTGTGRPTAHPEQLLPEYDLVFAKARAATEAMAAGCAVILLDHFGAGNLVTLAQLDTLRPLNFGKLAMRRPITFEHLQEQIAQYAPEDAAQVTARIRAEASLDATLPLLLALYQEASSMPVPVFEPGLAADDMLRLCCLLAKHYISLAHLPRVNPFTALRHRLDLKMISEIAAGTLEERRKVQQGWIEVQEGLTASSEELTASRQKLTACRKKLAASREKLAKAKERLLRMKQKRPRRISIWRSIWNRLMAKSS